MRHPFITSFATAFAVLLTAGSAGADEFDGHRLSGPVARDNLAIYFLHRATNAATPLTLEEAMESGRARVYETQDVNELEIENVGDEPVFVQSGDIVKGGQQDRTLAVSLVLPPRSGRVSIDAFCVEEGRWANRGKESGEEFSSAAAVVPSRQALLALRAPSRDADQDEPEAEVEAEDETEDEAKAEDDQVLAEASQRSSRRAYMRFRSPDVAADLGLTLSSRQSQVWEGVRGFQTKMSEAVGAEINAAESESSLALALENDKVEDAAKIAVDALRPAGEAADIVGVVVAINGALQSADLYPSAGLFRKLWPKLLEAKVNEAIGEKVEGAPELAPSIEAVKAFLEGGAAAKATEENLMFGLRLRTRSSDAILYSETLQSNGEWMHRAYLAK